jgi:hypothetical protein
MYSPGFGNDFGPFGGGGMFGVMFMIVFVLIVGVFIYMLVSSAARYAKNEASPRLSVSAKIVAKRTSVSEHHHADHMGSHSSTSYYATFEVESGDRMELPLSGHEYAMLAEGDTGTLTFQGTRFLGFERRR